MTSRWLFPKIGARPSQPRPQMLDAQYTTPSPIVLVRLADGGVWIGSNGPRIWRPTVPKV